MEKALLTAASPIIGNRVTGYVVNIAPDEAGRQKIVEVQQRVSQNFGDTVWSAPAEALHITLMDWIAPLVDYGQDKDELFEELFAHYDTALEQVLEGQAPIEVYFDTLKVTPDAIILIGRDDGSFQRIRSQFLERIELREGTKRPPQIIHSTIMRFQKEQPLQPIIDFVAQEQLSFRLSVRTVRLVKEGVLPQLEYEVVKEYVLT